MPARIPSRPLAAAAALAAAGAVTLAATAPAEPGHARIAAKRITPQGAGAVHIGDRYRTLRKRGLVGRIRPGCPLAENTRSARLKAPLKGAVNFTQTTPRLVTDIRVEGGAKARGVGVGARRRAIRKAFPKAKFDHSTESVFEITLVKVPRRGGGPLQFAVSTRTHRVTAIGVPFIAFCE